MKLLQYSLILKNKSIHPTGDFQNIPRTAKTRPLSTWDLILLQSKYMALDFHEERKWKRMCGHVFSHKIAMKVKRRRQSKTLDYLYQECLQISFSNNNSAETDMPMYDKVKSDLFPKNNNPEYLSNELVNWKTSLGELKKKLNKKFGESTLKKAEKFLKVLNLIENIIAMQEEKVKRIKSEKEKEKTENNNESVKLIDFVIQLESNSNYQDHYLYAEYAENSNLDYNKLHKEIRSIIEKLTNEVNLATEDVILQNQSLSGTIPNDQNPPTPTNNSTTNLNTLAIEAPPEFDSNQNTANTSMIKSPSSSFINDPLLNLDPEQKILNSINPNQLLFGWNFESPIQQAVAFFESYYKTDKCDTLPNYNYKKMLGSECDFDLEDKNDSSYDKIFPPVYYNDNLLIKGKRYFENDLTVYKTSGGVLQKKTQKDIEDNVAFSRFTPMQKLIFLWGISLYGDNKYIINEISNMFIFSRNINFDKDEMTYILENILDEIGIDLHGSNLSLLPKENFDNTSSFIESPIQIANTNTFNYSQQLKAFINKKIPTMRGDLNIREKFKLVTNYFGDIHKNYTHLYSPISFISKNPLLKSKDIKQKIYFGVKNQICKICDTIDTLSKNNISKYDYFNMTKATPSQNIINDLSTYDNIERMKKRKLDRESILKQLNGVKDKSELSCKPLTEEFLLKAKNGQNDVPKTIEIISFFSPDSIKKDWMYMRKPWYQNNKEFNPKFKRGNKAEEEDQSGRNSRQ